MKHLDWETFLIRSEHKRSLGLLIVSGEEPGRDFILLELDLEKNPVQKILVAV